MQFALFLGTFKPRQAVAAHLLQHSGSTYTDVHTVQRHIAQLYIGCTGSLCCICECTVHVILFGSCVYWWQCQQQVEASHNKSLSKDSPQLQMKFGSANAA